MQGALFARHRVRLPCVDMMAALQAHDPDEVAAMRARVLLCQTYNVTESRVIWHIDSKASIVIHLPVMLVKCVMFIPVSPKYEKLTLCALMGHGAIHGQQCMLLWLWTKAGHNPQTVQCCNRSLWISACSLTWHLSAYIASALPCCMSRSAG